MKKIVKNQLSYMMIAVFLLSSVFGYTMESTTAKTTKKMSKVTISLKENGLSCQAKLSFKVIKGVSGYEIYRSTNKKNYKKIKTVKSAKKKTTLKYVDDSLKYNKTYYYKVRPFTKKKSKKVYGKYSKVYKAKTPPLAVPKNIKWSLDDWNRVVFTYQIPRFTYCKVYRAVSDNGAYELVATSNASENTCKDTSAKLGQTYYYKLKTAIINGSNRMESDFSKVFCVKALDEYGNAAVNHTYSDDAADVPVQEPGENAVSDDISNEILVLMNAERRRVGAAPLRMDAALIKVAYIRAQDIHEYYEHTRPDGTSYYSLYKGCGATATSTVGENLMRGSKTAQEFFNAWMNSPGHYSNMIDKRFTKVGIAIYEDEDGYKCAAQEFAN